ncbi:hypothetical protein B0H13DRAFT_1850883 [Mycena leptocephala]|nr:hypothetical protein B0H13DRAFT_1850883 [Mycena leptocephala]
MHSIYRAALKPILQFLSPKPEYPCPTDVMGAGNCGKGLFSHGRIAQYALTVLALFYTANFRLWDRQTFVIEYAGNRIGSKQKDELLAQGCVYIFQVAPGEFGDASEPNEVNLARHINHSCDPNAVVELWNDPNGRPRALVISKRTIFPGEQITITMEVILCRHHVFVQNASKMVPFHPRVEKRRTQKYLGLTMV